MKRKLTCILLGSASALVFLSGCGGSDKELVAAKILSTCNTNKMSSGGYLWTYTDAGNGTLPGGGTVSPYTDLTTPFAVSDDAAEPGNKTCKFWGNRTGTSVADVQDTCGDTPLYPVSGMGFSFKDKNPLYSVCDKLGIRFRARGSVTAGTTPIVMRVSFPTAELDKRSEAEGDLWPAELQTCLCGVDTGDPSTKNCYGFYGKDISITTTWAWYQVLWGEITQESWAQKIVAGFNPEHVLKTQFDAPKLGDYEIEVDDIQFILPESSDFNWCALNVPIANLSLDPANPAASPLCTPVDTVNGAYAPNDPACLGQEPSRT